MIIKEVNFSYVDRTFPIGTYLGSCNELEVKSDSYDDIVDAIERTYPDYDDVKLMSFRNSYERKK
jgi:hypothetical protein